MFYSHLLLSKKGALGVVWMAAHCHKRLKKGQVQRTNISASVDKILVDEVPVVTHRILAFLLLGIVRIYSKKIEYLYHDCHAILSNVCSFKRGKSKHASNGVLQTRYQSIILPKRFELDTFDLELLEAQDLVGGNVRPHEQVVLAEMHQQDSNAYGLVHKENIPFSEAYSIANTPPRDVLSPHHMVKDLLVSRSISMNISSAGLEILYGTSSSLGDRMDPMELDEAEEEQMRNNPPKEDSRSNFKVAIEEMQSDSVAILSNNISNSVPSLEIARGAGFSLEDHLDPMVLDGAENGQTCDRPSNDNTRINFLGPIQDVEFNSVASPSSKGSDLIGSLGIPHKSGISLEHFPSFMMSNEAKKGEGYDELSQKEHGVAEGHVEHAWTWHAFQEDEPHDVTDSVGKAQPVAVNQMKYLEVITTESLECQRMDEFPASIVTPESKLPGLYRPEVVNIRTPATKERAKIVKKRKILIDSTLTLPNKVLKSWIVEDPSDLKREKRNVPCNLLQAWRAYKLVHVPQSFVEPLFSGVSENLGFLQFGKSCTEAIKSVELSCSQDNIRSPVTHKVHERIPDVSSPVTQRSPEQAPIFPGTPVTHLSPEQAPIFPGTPVTHLSPEQAPIAPGTPVTHLSSLRSHEIRATADSDILESTTSLDSTEKLPFCLVCGEETNLFEGDSLEKGTYSARTRMVGSYLSRKLVAIKRENEEEVLNLSQLLDGKSRKESARLFYEILVLKTRDCIDVQQENAYDDILLRKTRQTGAALGV